MQTRKKISARNIAKDNGNPKSSRLQKKATLPSEKKAADLITSSARKLRPGTKLLKLFLPVSFFEWDSYPQEIYGRVLSS